MLLLTLVLLVVGIASIVALNIIESNFKTNHQDAIKIEMLEVASRAIVYKNTPAILAGGGGSFFGFTPTGAEADNRTSHPATQNITFTNDVARYFLEFFEPNLSGISGVGIKMIASSNLYGNQHPSPANAGTARITVCFDHEGAIYTGGMFNCPQGFEVSGTW